MRRSIFLAIALAAASFAAVEPAAARQGQAEEGGALDVYTATVSPADAAELSQEGVDIIRSEQAGADVEVDAVLTEVERGRIEARTGIDLRVKRNRQGQSARQAAAAQAADGFEVWRSWDEAGGIRDELYEVAAENPQLVKLGCSGRPTRVESSSRSR